MFNSFALIRRGIRLPPSGWMLTGMLAFYVLAGLFGRDPWIGEDAIHIGTTWHMLSFNDWLTPELAGRPLNEPPLYYWSASLTGLAFGGILPLHEAMRLASGFWVTLALIGLYYAGRELYGQESAAASPMLLAGCAGLLIHAHDAQPMLVALAAYSGALGAFAAGMRRPRISGGIYGIALAACLLSVGIALSLPLIAILPFVWWMSPNRPNTLKAILLGLGLATMLYLPWPYLLFTHEPARFSAWLGSELAPLQTPLLWTGSVHFLALIPWLAFPAAPLAVWTLWLRRKQLAAPAQLLPLLFLLLILLVLTLAYRPRPIPALLMLPPLALFATPGALGLRRGAANAFDWFAMMTFSFFTLVVWLCWSAMALGWPEKLAHRALVLRPGFISHIDLLALGIGIAATLWWVWLIVTAPRSPYRSLTHWTLGFTSLWLLATALILPWFDYGKSYRPLAEAVAAAMPDKHACLAERGLTDDQRASLAYFIAIEPLAFDNPAAKRCDLLLVAGDTRQEQAAPDTRWHKVWEGSRPADRREKLRLFKR